MNAHIKTIITIISAISIVAALIAFPKFAFVCWIGLWCAVGILAATCIYGWIYMLFEEPYVEPEKNIEEAPSIDRLLDRAYNNIDMAMGLMELGKAHKLLEDAQWQIISAMPSQKNSE